jgi:hypothetical protein
MGRGDSFDKTIRRTLRQLSRQRVRLILQPGNIFVIDNAVDHDDDTDAALRTCWLRGWVEPVENAVPFGKLLPDGRLPDRPLNQTSPVFRMTDAGWSVLHRSHLWSLMAVLMGFLSVCAGFTGGFLVQWLTPRSPWFAHDSPLEGDGFEPSVPRAILHG